MRKDWLTIVVAVIGAVAIIAIYAVMEQRNVSLRSEISRVTAERDALQAEEAEGGADVAALVKQRDKPWVDSCRLRRRPDRVRPCVQAGRHHLVGA